MLVLIRYSASANKDIVFFYLLLISLLKHF
jgi:hypothetical protein